MVKEYNWTKRNELTIADDKTMFKLSCRHEPHSLVVLTPGRVTNMITVQCTEPQTIHDLMRKHGLIALMIPRGPSVNYTPEISTFYHNMNHIKVRARRKALRYNPYVQHFQSSGATISSKESDPTEDLITVALYYEDNMSRLSSVIEADGRFVSCHTTEGYCGEYIAEIQQDNDIILTVPTCAEDERDSQTEEEEDDHPLPVSAATQFRTRPCHVDICVVGLV
ncbi:hypothetical protein D5F01_LYC24075 [Larimichthys crocea]|uniref:Uncharacterized protein n=1 Tax=Larimichthys crocea TaxID=215358 RepID=A0A6G0HFA0_LARCR|nr:hypothetical protein D5F01_LYC24075 [Larimichthys crocea]